MLRCLLGGLLVGSLPTAAQDFREIPAQELVRNPQHYWSVGVLFRDTLSAPPAGRAIRIGATRYFEFTTRTIGRCYAPEDVVPALQALIPGREYLFTGTVLSRGQGALRHRPVFHIVVHKVAESLGGENGLPDRLLQSAAAASSVGGTRAAEAVVRVFSAAHAGLVTYAQQQGLSPADLFEPGSAHAAKAADIIQSVLLAAQREEGVPAIEMLGQLVRDTLAYYYGARPVPEERVRAAPRAKRKSISLKTGAPVAPAAGKSAEAEPAPPHGAVAERVQETAPAKKPVPPKQIPLNFEMPVGR